MSNNEIYKQCVIDVKQFYKKLIFNSKKESVTHPIKPYNRSGKSPYPFDKFVGKIAKHTCQNKNFFDKYENVYQIQRFFDNVRELKRDT